MRTAQILRKSRWITVFALLLAALLLYIAFRGVDWTELWRIIQSARLEYLALACLLASANCLLRSLRWLVLLSAERWLGVLDVFWAMMVGYLGNLFLPVRAGEVVRSVALGHRVQINAGFVLATALTERILDAGVLVLIGSAALTTLHTASPTLLNAGKGMAILSAGGLVGVFILPVLERPFQWVLAHLPLPFAWKTLLSGLLEQFSLGMRSLRHTGRALSFLALTAVIWLGDAVVAITVAYSVGMAISIPQAFLLIVALGLSSAIPSTPGYIGVYQFVAVTVLHPFGFTNSQALAYIICFQALGYIVLTWWGLLGLWKLEAFRKQAEITTNK